MGKYIYDMILMGISSSITLILAQLLYHSMQKKHARWYYSMLVTAVLMLIIPVQSLFSLPKLMSVTVPENIVYTQPYEISSESTIYLADIIFLIWASIAFAMMIFTAVKYFRTSRILKSLSNPTDNKVYINAFRAAKASMGISRQIELMESKHISSPLLFGLIHPKIIIPTRDFTDDELSMIMTHELTHYRHMDLIIKLISSLGACVQWFNPTSHILKRNIVTACELCCDESVLDTLKLSDNKEYGRLILSVMEDSLNKNFFCSTSMASTEKGIKKRLMKIVEFKHHSVAFRMVSIMLILASTVCSVTAFGVEYAKEILPEETTEFITEIEQIVLPNIEETPSIEPIPNADGTVTPQPIPNVYETSAPSYVISSYTYGTPNDYVTESDSQSLPAIPTYIPATEQPVKAANETPEAEQSPPTERPVVKTEPDEAYGAPPQINEPTKEMSVVITDSINFNGEVITENNSKTVEVKTGENISLDDSKNVKAYIKINDDGTYSVLRTEEIDD